MAGIIISRPIHNYIYDIAKLPVLSFSNALDTYLSIYVNMVLVHSNMYPGSAATKVIPVSTIVAPFLIDIDQWYGVTVELSDSGGMFADMTNFMYKGSTTFISDVENNGLYFQNNIPDICFTKGNWDRAIFTLKDSTNTVILVEKYVFDTDGLITIRNLKDIIQNYFSNPFTVESVGTTNINTKLVLDFSSEIRMINDDANYSYQSNFKVLKCDVNMPYEASSWTANNFLTRSYLEKKTAVRRNEYLSFLMKNSYGVATIRYKAVYLVDGVRTEIIGTLGTIAQQVGDNNVATFNASLYRIKTVSNLANYTKVLQYDIWLTGTGLSTKIYTFLVDNVEYRNSKSFAFTNCFGVLETFTATGTSANKKYVEYNLANIDSHYRKLTQDFYSEKECNSGFVSDTEADWLDDFIRSYAILRYTQNPTDNEEITLTAIDKTDSEANELQAFSFTYRPAKNLHISFQNAVANISEFTFEQTFE